MGRLLSRFSLQKQLLIIFSFLTAVVLGLIFTIINLNFNSVIDDQMYSTLTMAQEDYLTLNASFETTNTKKQIYHMYYDSQTDVGYPALTMSRDDIIALRDVFIDGLSEFITSEESYYYGKGEYYSNDMYYIITKMEDSKYMISIMYSDYSSDLVDALQQEVFNLFYGAFCLIGIVLLLWVSSLIAPLRAIKHYIEDIKEQRDTRLVINRQDEIGLVSRSLTEMKEKIDLENKVKEEMIHNISHDLKTPIALIRTYSESVKDDIYPYGDKDSSMDVIIENADRLDKKVRSLLHLNRLDYFDSVEQSESIEIDQVILHLAEQIRLLYPEIELELNLEKVSYLGEEENWRKCIENIIENAYRYAKTKIIITLNTEKLEIFNDGPAIDMDNMEELYKPYRKGVNGQFGLGLSIVYKTVTVYGYRVEALNKEDGVSFIISKNIENNF